MKKTVKYKGRDIIMRCTEMSHSSVGGEYEIGFSEKMELNLGNILKKLKNSGYQQVEVKDRSLSLSRDNTVVTVLKKGRILIEDLLPDTFEEAVKIGEEVMNGEQEG